MDSVLTYKETILAWHEGLTAFDHGDSEKALEMLLQIPPTSATSRILYNIGHIYLIQGQYTEAAKNFEAAFEKDVHLAAAFYQCGVALYRSNKFNHARKMFEKSKECLRESQYIDYKALGMACRLYKCEILFNLSVAVSAMTKDPEWALDILNETDKCEKETSHVQVIQSAKIQLREGVNPTIFSLPQKEMFRPPKDKIENISKKDYLGQSTVVHAVPGSSIKKASKPKEEKILDLPTPGQKRQSLVPPARTPTASNTFKPINSLDPRVSPTPPNRLPPSPTSPPSHPHPSNNHGSSPTPPGRPPLSGGRPTPSPTPPGRPPPSGPGRTNSNEDIPHARTPPAPNTFKPINSLDPRVTPTPPNRQPPSGPGRKNSNDDRPTPSPTPPMRPPPLGPNRLNTNSGGPSPSPSPTARLPPQNERSNSGGKGPPTRPPPSSKLSSTHESSQSSPVNEPSSNKLSHKDTIVIWDEAMSIYQTGQISEALEKLLSIPEPTAKILFNIGSIQLLTDDVSNAKKTFEAAVERDEHMAIGFFQYGIALALQTEYQLAWKAFDKARRALRKNDSIDYKQIGLPYKLYECEVLHNQSLMYMYLDDQKVAKEVLELALKKKSEIRHSKIDTAMDKLKASSYFDLFTIPKDAVFKPPASKVENIKKVDYLGQKKVVAKFEEREFISRPSKLPPRLSATDLGSTEPNLEVDSNRRSSSPGISITYHDSIDAEDIYVFENAMDDNRCYSPPDLDENDDDIDTYGPVPDFSSLRASSPGPPTRLVPSPPTHLFLQRVGSLGPPTRDAPPPPLPSKREEFYTNFGTNNNTANSSLMSPTNKKPFPSPKPKGF